MRNIITTETTFATPQNALAKLEREAGGLDLNYLIATVRVGDKDRFAPVVLVGGAHEATDLLHLAHRGITIVG